MRFVFDLFLQTHHHIPLHVVHQICLSRLSCYHNEIPCPVKDNHRHDFCQNHSLLDCWSVRNRHDWTSHNLYHCHDESFDGGTTMIPHHCDVVFHGLCLRNLCLCAGMS